MAEEEKLTTLKDLKLNVVEREKVAEVAGDLVAVQVYRELQRAKGLAIESASGCNIIGNCSSSSKDAMLQ